MSRPPMLENIFAQPASLREVMELSGGKQHAVLATCANLIRKAHGRVVFSGMGASYFAAWPAVSRMEQQGYPMQMIDSSELLHYGSSGLRPEDVGILISRSGGSVEVVRLAEKMRAAGMSIIAVTNAPGTPLEQLADQTLLIGSQADQQIAIQTYTGSILMLLLLAEQVLGRESARLSSACLAALPALSAYIEECWQVSDSWKELFDGPGALYLLGRGPALASVHEGALLLHETAKVAAVGMSAGQFRHGPVEVVSDQFRGLVFGTSAVTRELDRSLADDLVRMGGKVRWIGPAAESTGSGVVAESLVPWPQIGSVFAQAMAPIFEIVPLQIAAYRLALWRDITPGDFLFASEITTKETGFPLFSAKAAGKRR